jgi:citrate synthase
VIEAAPWASGITDSDRERVYLRGEPIDEIIGRDGFAATILHVWTGARPSDAEAAVLEACLVAGVDHGPITPSAIAARTASSVRQDPVVSVAAGLLTVTALHGGAVTTCMEMLGEDADVDEPLTWARGVAERRRREGRRVPGIGHRSHDDDIRATRLLEFAARTLGRSSRVERMQALATVVAERVGRPIPVNIDGATGAALAELGLDPVYGNLAFVVSRSVGLAAHVVEERTRERPMRMIDPTQVKYDGPRRSEP